MNLKIACKNPYHCNFECLNCPYSFEFDKFNKIYNEINEIALKIENINNIIEK